MLFFFFVSPLLWLFEASAKFLKKWFPAPPPRCCCCCNCSRCMVDKTILRRRVIKLFSSPPSSSSKEFAASEAIFQERERERERERVMRFWWVYTFFAPLCCVFLCVLCKKKKVKKSPFRFCKKKKREKKEKNSSFLTFSLFWGKAKKKKFTHEKGREVSSARFVWYTQ